MTEWHRLKEPFPADEIEWRIGRSGIKSGGEVWATCLAYVTARAIQNRLDEVFGVGGWKNEYRPGPAGGVVCRIYFRDDSGEWVWREDGSGDMEANRGLSETEASKGTLSAALKRAGSALGIGRYLYELEEDFARVHEKGRFRGEAKGEGSERVRFKWDPPALPAWAVPPDDHSRLLEFIREAGARGTEAMQTAIRTRWDGAKRDRREARALADFVEESTGERAPT